MLSICYESNCHDFSINTNELVSLRFCPYFATKSSKGLTRPLFSSGTMKNYGDFSCIPDGLAVIAATWISLCSAVWFFEMKHRHRHISLQSQPRRVVRQNAPPISIHFHFSRDKSRKLSLCYSKHCCQCYNSCFE